MRTDERTEELDFDLARVIGYHQMRAGFYRTWHQRAMVAVVLALIFPAAALLEPTAKLLNSLLSLGDNSLSSQSIAALFTFGGVMAAVADILIDPAGKAARHRATSIVYQSIRNDNIGNLSDVEINALEQRYERVDSGFEDRHVVVNIVSGNRVAQVTGRETMSLPLWRRFLMHYFTFSAFRG